MNKKDLPAVFSTAFWCLFVVLLFFFLLYCVTTVTPFIERSEVHFVLLHHTWVAMRFLAKITSSCIWVAITVDCVMILNWYACGAVGRTDFRAYGHVITKISRMGILPHFLRYEATSTYLEQNNLLSVPFQYIRLEFSRRMIGYSKPYSSGH